MLDSKDVEISFLKARNAYLENKFSDKATNKAIDSINRKIKMFKGNIEAFEFFSCSSDNKYVYVYKYWKSAIQLLEILKKEILEEK